MWPIKSSRKAIVLSSVILLSLSLCKRDRCANEKTLLLTLSKQGAEFTDFIDSLKLEEDPKKYNLNYECLSFAEIGDAPEVLDKYYLIFKTSHFDSIGYISFDNYYEVAGIPKSKLIVSANFNRERAYFSVLTYEDKGALEHRPFIVMENVLDILDCEELDFTSIQFKGNILEHDQLEIKTIYRYKNNCKDREEKLFEKKMTLNL